MEKIIPPLDRALLLKELTPDKFVRKTNMGDNELYDITYHDSPHLLNEIGRLREMTFRYAGGGTGKKSDIDKYDIAENPYRQLIVWDPNTEQILGGYRYFICSKNTNYEKELATAGLFHFNESFINDYMPYTIELGRSFVQPDYQSTSRFRKAIFALDNLWDGLGAIVYNHPDKKYLFGKVTIYQSYNTKARDLLYYFMDKHFKDKKLLLYPKKSFPLETDTSELSEVLNGKSYEDDHKLLSQAIRQLGENIPPLINAYMNLSPTMINFGSSINPYFGDVIETGIMVTIGDIYKDKIDRYVGSYKAELKQGN